MLKACHFEVGSLLNNQEDGFKGEGMGGRGTHPFAVHLTVEPVALKGRSVFGSVCSHAILQAFSPLTLVLIPWRKMADIVDLPSQ